jgi:PD-(D/E)XK endonuclease
MEDTKLKGDIAEQAVVLYALRQDWGVSIPVGDRLPYDLIIDVKGTLLKIQVKSAWFDKVKNNYVVDNRRTKTNRRNMVRASYDEHDFDFAILYIDSLDVFYIMPSEVFISYGSEIHLIETNRRQRKPKSALYRNAWKIIEQRAASVETPE